MQKKNFLVVLLSLSIVHIHVMYSSEVQALSSTLPIPVTSASTHTNTFNGTKSSPRPVNKILTAPVRKKSERQSFESGSMKSLLDYRAAAALLATQQQ